MRTLPDTDHQQARITASASGKLESFTLKAQGSGAGLTGQGEAQLKPFTPFPLAALTLSVNGLDPRAFSPDAPQASLALQAQLHQNAAGKLEGEVSAKNVSPAPLDQGGLPLHEIRSRATISAENLQFDALNLILAGGGQHLRTPLLAIETSNGDGRSDHQPPRPRGD